MSVRMGRFGPFVQIGTKDDVEKPRFAGLRPGQNMDKITREDALALFILPRTLGSTAEGEPILANVGRFGPYIKYGSKYVSLKEDDPYTVTLERALECIQAKQLADANRIIRDFGVDGIQLLNGRYGPYVSNGEKNARIPKDRDPKTLTLEDSRALLAAAPVRPMRGRGRFASRKKAAAKPDARPDASADAKPAGRRRVARAPGAATAPQAVAAKATSPTIAVAPAKGNGSRKTAHAAAARRPPSKASAKSAARPAPGPAAKPGMKATAKAGARAPAARAAGRSAATKKAAGAA